MADLGDLSNNSLDPKDGFRFEFDTSGINPKPWNNSLSGTVTVTSAAAIKRVVAIDRFNYKYVGSTISDALGVWGISGVSEEASHANLIVIAFDDTGTYNAEVADMIQIA